MTNKPHHIVSNNLYTSDKHSHWLDYIEPKNSVANLKAFEDKLRTGRRLTDKQSAAANGVAYNHLQHNLDLVSGEYKNVLQLYARKMIAAQLDAAGTAYDADDLKYTTNFTSTAQNSPESRLSREYYDAGSYYFDGPTGTITIEFKEVEDYAQMQVERDAA